MSAVSSKQKAELRSKESAESYSVFEKNLPWNWVQGLLVGLMALVGADILVSILLGIVGGTLQNTPFGIADINQLIESQSVSFNFFLYLLARLLGLALIYWFIRRRGVSLRQFGFRRFNLGKSLGYVAAASATLIIATVVVFAILQQAAPSLNLEQEQEIVFTAATGKFEVILAFIALVIVAPIAEEAIFRGLMLPAFAARFGWVGGAVLVSAIFGAVHWQLNVGIVTFVMGLLLAWIYYRSRSLWPAIMFHSLKNLVAFILIF